MPVYDELYKFKDQFTHVLTEQGTTHAAQGMQATGKVGVAINFRSWTTNLVTGIADAQIDSTPVCITGQVGKHLWVLMPFRKQNIMEFQLQ
jgi:acetolactate synthase-1/2/3 large subunit